MVWNWSYDNTVVFSWWRTSSALGLGFTCLLVMVISLASEMVSFLQAQQDREALVQETTYASLAAHGTVNYQTPGKAQRAFLYGVRTYLSILLMLIMMTFNGYLIFSIIVGAVLGHYALGHR